MPDAVHTRKLDDQRPALQPAVDLALREAGCEELSTRDHTMSLGRQPSDHLVHLAVLPTHMVGKAER